MNSPLEQFELFFQTAVYNGGNAYPHYSPSQIWSFLQADYVIIHVNVVPFLLSAVVFYYLFLCKPVHTLVSKAINLLIPDNSYVFCKEKLIQISASFLTTESVVFLPHTCNILVLLCIWYVLLGFTLISHLVITFMLGGTFFTTLVSITFCINYLYNTLLKTFMMSFERLRVLKASVVFKLRMLNGFFLKYSKHPLRVVLFVLYCTMFTYLLHQDMGLNVYQDIFLFSVVVFVVYPIIDCKYNYLVYISTIFLFWTIGVKLGLFILYLISYIYLILPLLRVVLLLLRGFIRNHAKKTVHLASIVWGFSLSEPIISLGVVGLSLVSLYAIISLNSLIKPEDWFGPLNDPLHKYVVENQLYEMGIESSSTCVVDFRGSKTILPLKHMLSLYIFPQAEQLQLTPASMNYRSIQFEQQLRDVSHNFLSYLPSTQGMEFREDGVVPQYCIWQQADYWLPTTISYKLFKATTTFYLKVGAGALEAAEQQVNRDLAHVIVAEARVYFRTHGNLLGFCNQFHIREPIPTTTYINGWLSTLSCVPCYSHEFCRKNFHLPLTSDTIGRYF